MARHNLMILHLSKKQKRIQSKKNNCLYLGLLYWAYRISATIKINGYIPSKLATDLMPQAIKTVMRGFYYFPRDGKLKEADKTNYNNSREFDIEFLKLVNSLSPGQNKVACLLSHDMLNPQIAKVLDISVKGVENHVRRIYEKLNIFPDEEQARSRFNHYFGEYFRGRQVFSFYNRPRI